MKTDIAELTKTYRSVRESLTCNVRESDYEKIASHLDALRELSEAENRAVAVYDLHKKLFLMKEDDHLDLLGYGKSLRMDDADMYHAMIHPKDLAFLYETEIKTHEFLRGKKGEEKKDYKLVYDYRVKNREGKYMRFLHQLKILELDRDGNSWLMLVISDVLSTYAQDVRPRRFVIHTKTRKICLFNEESGVHSLLLSKRESEILRLLSEGLDSAAIGDRLCISTSTVNNHRQRILLKTKTRNITEAATYSKKIGLI